MPSTKASVLGALAGEPDYVEVRVQWPDGTIEECGRVARVKGLDEVVLTGPDSGGGEYFEGGGVQVGRVKDILPRSHLAEMEWRVEESTRTGQVMKVTYTLAAIRAPQYEEGLNDAALVSGIRSLMADEWNPRRRRR